MTKNDNLLGGGAISIELRLLHLIITSTFTNTGGDA
jgi:hypothetical protein